ncbi:DUF3035 domain-containing protein [Roseomonas eburnea]|uniref:DUF3035 domain-containing protein n=1 Tax=Neoroseomonas eburnea TaxID=1346889 RepID=A0A9X9XJ98_9PROT|nr:DUF3035 domain-containing protein [Neoroseomonas eburnea]MBR0683784.1 DUF3035 domain-containing protein [Neoroseomonas eburnea]
MRTRPIPPLAAVAAAVLLSACGQDTGRTLGLVRDAPDEFQVTTRAPLSMPPDMTTLPTPRPGAPRPQERTARGQAEALLVPGLSLDDPRRAPGQRVTVGEAALIQRAGPDAPEDIRRRVDEESLRLDQPNRTLTDRLIFWREPPPPGTAVDPTREAQRLRENAALGRDEAAGVTPVEQPRRRTFWERLGL